MKNKNDLIRDITEHLNQSVENLDPQILSRIRAARHNALEKKRPGFLPWALPVGGIAVAAIVLSVAVNLVTGPANRSTPQSARVVETTVVESASGEKKNFLKENTESKIQADQIELVEILSSDQQLDFFENLEFYAWLAEDENITG